LPQRNGLIDITTNRREKKKGVSRVAPPRRVGGTLSKERSRSPTGFHGKKEPLIPLP